MLPTITWATLSCLPNPSVRLPQPPGSSGLDNTISCQAAYSCCAGSSSCSLLSLPQAPGMFPTTIPLTLPMEAPWKGYSTSTPRPCLTAMGATSLPGLGARGARSPRGRALAASIMALPLLGPPWPSGARWWPSPSALPEPLRRGRILELCWSFRPFAPPVPTPEHRMAAPPLSRTPTQRGGETEPLRKFRPFCSRTAKVRMCRQPWGCLLSPNWLPPSLLPPTGRCGDPVGLEGLRSFTKPRSFQVPLKHLHTWAPPVLA